MHAGLGERAHVPDVAARGVELGGHHEQPRPLRTSARDVGDDVGRNIGFDQRRHPARVEQGRAERPAGQREPHHVTRTVPGEDVTKRVVGGPRKFERRDQSAGRDAGHDVETGALAGGRQTGERTGAERAVLGARGEGEDLPAGGARAGQVPGPFRGPGAGG